VPKTDRPRKTRILLARLSVNYYRDHPERLKSATVAKLEEDLSELIEMTGDLYDSVCEAIRDELSERCARESIHLQLSYDS